MVATPSAMLPLGTPAPDFSLPDPRSGETVGLADVSGQRGLVVAFVCNHCPFVKNIVPAFVAKAREFQGQGVGVVAISSNDVENYPDDAPEKMASLAEREGFPFPYLYDGTQEVARAYQAACTPDFFLFDEGRKLVYRGQFDPSRPDNGVEPDGRDLDRAVRALLRGETVPEEEQTPSMGCNIKWKR